MRRVRTGGSVRSCTPRSLHPHPPASASAFGKRPENAYSAGRAGTCVDELSTVPDAQQAHREG